MHTCMHINTQTYRHVHTHIYTQAHTQTHRHTHANTDIHNTHMHTETYANKHIHIICRNTDANIFALNGIEGKVCHLVILYNLFLVFYLLLVTD